MNRKLFGSLGAAVLSVIALCAIAVLVAPGAQAAWPSGGWPRPTTTAPAPTSSSPAPSSTPAPTTSPAPTGGLTALEQDAWNRINAERTKAGCAALIYDQKIEDVARAHSVDMRDRNYFDHSTPEGVSPAQRLTNAGVPWRSMGENIARGQRDAATVVTGWMNSSGHRANILNCGFTRSGLGVATGGNGPYWTQDFVG
jgi:uncharacterized protein YkwD